MVLYVQTEPSQCLFPEPERTTSVQARSASVGPDRQGGKVQFLEQDVMREGVTDLSPSLTNVDDETTRELTRIWEQLLGIRPIRLDQNYFDLGGDSPLAVQLFAQIEKAFKVKLPLATLFEAPTIEELAGDVRSDIDAAHERDHLAAGDLLDSSSEVVLGGVLEEHAHITQPLLLADRGERALDGRERVLEEAHERVRAGVEAAHALGPAAELLLVNPHHRAADLHELRGHALERGFASRAVSLRRLLVGSHGSLASASLLGANRSKWRHA